MKASKVRAPAPKPLIKFGETYRERSSGILVTAEDHEVQQGRRTGRIVVRAADGVFRFPRRWHCRADELVEEPPGASTGKDQPGGRP